jgi:hypothetical protein
MSAYVLIILMGYAGGYGGPAATSVPFATLEACQAAIKAVRADYQTSPKPTYGEYPLSMVCVSTGGLR